MPFANRRSRTLAVAAVTALVLPLSLAPHASAKVEKTEIPEGSSVRIEGKGFGHGRGMSQYGAQGAARKGLGHEKIIEFYYPGTAWGSAGGDVKVLLSADTTDDVVVQARSGLKVRDIAARKAVSLPSNGAVQWRLQVDSKKRTAVQWRAKTTAKWKTWARYAGEAQFGAGNRPMALVLPSGKKVEYRGVLRSASPVKGGTARDTVNVVSLETYLRGVVPLEIPAAWHPEAVRAQSVAARTYATFERSTPLAKHYQICDTTRCQVYGGASAENKLSDAAVKGTAKKIVTYGGKPAFTQFSSSNGGWAQGGSLPYQISRADPYDGWTGNPVHDWSTTVAPSTIERAWPAMGDLERISVTGRTGNGAYGGRVTSVTLVGSKSKVRISGDSFRSALGLRSTWVDLSAVQNTKAAKKAKKK